MKKTDLGHGFVIGDNWIFDDGVKRVLGLEKIHWNSFIWYIARTIKIVEYSNSFLRLAINSQEEKDLFMRILSEYKDESETKRYHQDVDLEDYKNWYTYEKNKKIIEKLARSRKFQKKAGN
jgi:hypothetical protein